MAQCRRELKALAALAKAPAVLAKALAALALASLLIGEAAAQTTASPAALTPTFGKKRGLNGLAPAGSPSPELENVRKALEALTPEQREQFRQNFARWSSLTPDDKKSLRDLQEIRRKHMQDETEEAITQSGLQLDPIRRQVFAKRYSEERRKIEESLRKEMEEKRIPRVEELRKRLKAEFSAP